MFKLDNRRSTSLVNIFLYFCFKHIILKRCLYFLNKHFCLFFSMSSAFFNDFVICSYKANNFVSVVDSPRFVSVHVQQSQSSFASNGHILRSFYSESSFKKCSKGFPHVSTKSLISEQSSLHDLVLLT